MAYASASTLVIAARAAGYRELIVGRSIVQNICSGCGKKRLIRFRKTAGKRGPQTVDKCYGCGNSVAVKGETPSTKKPAAKRKKSAK
jgi:hypothetical protein